MDLSKAAASLRRWRVVNGPLDEGCRPDPTDRRTYSRSRSKRSTIDAHMTDRFQPERVDQNYAANDTSVQMVSAEASPHQPPPC